MDRHFCCVSWKNVATRRCPSLTLDHSIPDVVKSLTSCTNRRSIPFTLQIGENYLSNVRRAKRAHQNGWLKKCLAFILGTSWVSRNSSTRIRRKSTPVWREIMLFDGEQNLSQRKTWLGPSLIIVQPKSDSRWTKQLFLTRHWQMVPYISIFF